MNRSFVLCVAVLFGISFIPVQADNPRTFSSQVVRAPAPSPTPQNKQKPALQPPTAKCPPSKPTPPNCNDPCQKMCPTVVIYPSYYTYPVYSYPAYYPVTSYRSSRSSYGSDENSPAAGKDENYDISYEDDYWKRGRNWGQDLRREIVEFEDLVTFLAQEIISAPESLRSQFRKGFAEGYGLHGDKAFEKAFELASKPAVKADQPPKSIE